MFEYSDIPMFYGAPADIFCKAKQLRQNMTLAEKKLWNFLKGKNLFGLRFRPQHPMGFYIADFYCHKLNLVIEIDGEIHNSESQREHDFERTRDLNKWEIDVIRFTNDQVMNYFESVKETLVKEVQVRITDLTITQVKSPL
jgi:very-short-patch-repair endonuclease